MIKKGLVQVMLMVFHKRGDESIRTKAKEVTMRIEDEEATVPAPGPDRV